MFKSPKIIILCGPTASGKSARALELARANNGVIINADSQQMYENLRVLTARPNAEEEALIPHKLYGFLPAREAGSAALWLTHAKMEIDWALKNEQTPIVTGGTGLYIKSLMYGIADIPAIPAPVRAQAEADLHAMGGAAFHARLAEIDAEAAARIRPSDSQRLVRAYAVWLGTGKPLSWWHSRGQKSFYSYDMFDILKVIPERAALYDRINARTEEMMEMGAVAEVEQLLGLQLAPDLPAMRIIGVPELRDYLEGRTTLNEAIARLQQATRNYAKRQLTWFRHQLPN